MQGPPGEPPSTPTGREEPRSWADPSMPTSLDPWNCLSDACLFAWGKRWRGPVCKWRVILHLRAINHDVREILGGKCHIHSPTKATRIKKCPSTVAREAKSVINATILEDRGKLKNGLGGLIAAETPCVTVCSPRTAHQLLCFFSFLCFSDLFHRHDAAMHVLSEAEKLRWTAVTGEPTEGGGGATQPQSTYVHKSMSIEHRECIERRVRGRSS